MRKTFQRGKNSVRFYVLLVAFLLFFFFSNDFGLIDIQKTAIVIGVGVDREADEFVMTSQIAVPQASKQGEQVQPVQIESRGKTVAQAFAAVNEKTGWYPKLVFCNLVVLGKAAAEKNVFEILDYFLRDDYTSDNCRLAVCDGSAKDFVTVKTPIEDISGLAVQKVLSEHSARVGLVAPTTLRSFAMGYFSASRSGFMPVLSKSSAVGNSGGSSGGEGGSSGGSGGEKGGSGSEGGQNLFSASETALFYDGVMVGKLNKEQTFALAAVKEKLRLASFYPESAGAKYSLLVKKNEPKVKFFVDRNGAARLDVEVTVTAGIEDVSVPDTVTELGEVGSLPSHVKKSAEEKLKKSVEEVFALSAASGCDLFGAVEKLRKYEPKYFAAYKNDLLSRIQLRVKVKFRPFR